MGSLAGHLLPGTFFICFAIRWAWVIFHRYFACLFQDYQELPDQKHKIRYKNECSNPVVMCGRTFPIESALKMIAAALGMTGEYATAYHGSTFAVGNGQHMTMFFFFGLHGAVELLQFYTYPLPPNLDYVTGILAFGIEALLFYYHLHGRPHMDIQVHMFLFYVILGAVISLCMELKWRHNVVAGLSRCYFVLLQGSWFYTVGFILYPIYQEHEWDQDDHQQMMTVTIIFAWHNAATFIFLFIWGTLICWRVKRMESHNLYKYLPPPEYSKHCPATVSKLKCEQIKQFINVSDDEEVC